MLEAINKNTGESIRATDKQDFRAEYPGWQDLVDKILGLPVVPVSGYIRGDVSVRSYFRSTAKLIDWPDDLMRDPEYMTTRAGGISLGESAEHQQGKLFVQANAHLVDSILKPELAQFELRLHLPTGKYRIIDVAFCLPSGLIVAHEVQLAAITPEELEERSEDYRTAGVDVIWWLGNRANTQANINWHYSYFGYHPVLLDCHKVQHTDCF